MAKIMLAAGLIVAYGYLMETFTAWYSGDVFEQFMLSNRMFGPFGAWYWMLILTNIVIPQALWITWVRNSPLTLFFVAMVINFGMWLERFVIVIVSLHRDYLPSSWGSYMPTFWDWATYLGTIGLFVSLLFLFIRLLPMISIFEMRELLEETKERQP
jgi:molybdopterin-containing oxidoreductase family membrane subunit